MTIRSLVGGRGGRVRGHGQPGGRDETVSTGPLDLDKHLHNDVGEVMMAARYIAYSLNFKNYRLQRLRTVTAEYIRRVYL